jgi:hypothetical protein
MFLLMKPSLIRADQTGPGRSGSDCDGVGLFGGGGGGVSRSAEFEDALEWTLRVYPSYSATAAITD